MALKLVVDNTPITDLGEALQKLTTLHEQLRSMLKELEELIED